jgi:hypothetical protein
MLKEHVEYVLFINSLWLYVKTGYTITTGCLIRKDSLSTFFVDLFRKIMTLLSYISLSYWLPSLSDLFYKPYNNRCHGDHYQN